MSDFQIRLKAFDWLEQQVLINGEVLPRKLLLEGFINNGEKVSLISPAQGIFKPRMMVLPLSITTSPKGPYEDSFREDGFLDYKYRGTDPYQRDNVGLRTAMKEQIPLIYFHGIEVGRYVPSWPVYIIGDDPSNLSFKVSVDDMNSILQPESAVVDEEARRRYITTNVKVRLHQSSFREKVLRAYQSQCALCRLKHIELLDAAHIIPDSDPQGRPEVTNGISLCKLHHAAFDSFIIGLTPDYTIEIREDILDETDGPMLQHGLKELHKSKIVLPVNEHQWPNKDFLDQRFCLFRNSF